MSSKQLAEWDAVYNENLCLVGRKLKGVGYHTTLPDGAWVHSTTDSLRYALALLKTGEQERMVRAEKVIRKVISLQDQNPENHTYGIWSWFYEEPLEQMSPPDWNWADFCGEVLVEMLKEHSAVLDKALMAEMKTSLTHAARCIIKRDVQPSYTNIAVLGGSVTVAAGELLAEPEFLEYGRKRLEKFVAFTEHHGNFSEYNSPNYSFVVINACNDLIKLVDDPVAKSAGEKIQRFCWENIAKHFHPATGQWAGPHSRMYTELFPPARLEYVRENIPEDLKPRLQKLPEPAYQMNECFIRYKDAKFADVCGTTWFTEQACLSTVNHENMWVQRRVFLGYWMDAPDEVAVLRCRFLHDGKDFASAYILNEQRKNKTLTAITFLTDGGDYHVCLDKPKDGCFEASDFRVRFEIAAKDVSGEGSDDGTFILKSQTHSAVIHPMPWVFDKETVKWELTEEEGKIALDGICYSGNPKKFNFAEIGEVVIAAGLELIESGGEAAKSYPQYEYASNDTGLITWEGMQVTSPKRPQPIRYFRDD